jgi:hypothetical protein
VTAQDAYGNTATGYRGTVHFTSSDAQAALPSNYTFTSADAGTHTFTATLKTTGGQSLTATDTSTGSITGSETGITVNPAAASILVVSGFPSPTMAGAAHSLTVTAEDAYGNTATGYRGTVHFTSSDAQAVLPANYTFTSGDAGSHTFTATLKTAGSQSLTATDTSTGSITGSQTGITVNPAAASSLVVSGFPSPTTAGASNNFTVTAEDAYGNTATGYRGAVHFTSSDAQAVLPANYTFTSGDAGSHTFSATLKTAASQSLTATDTSTGSITASETGITVNPAAASSLVVSGFPSTTTAGVSNNFTVTAEDAYGNTATGYRGTVHFTSSDAQAVLPANYTFTSSDAGSHSFTATLKTAGSQSLTATDTSTGSITGTQSGITVNPAAASTLTVSAPGNVTAGAAFSITVTANDPYGNTATAYRGTVHFTSSDSQASLPADYAFTAADNGSHVFANGVTLATTGNQTETATDTNSSTFAGTANVTVSAAGTATHFAVSAPSSTSAGVAFSFTVTALDANGNTVTGYTGTVDFASSSQSATLPGAYTFTSSDQGVHTFSANLNITGTQTLNIDSGSGITGVDSSINITQTAGNTYYVSTTGSDSNPGTITQPFATINYGVSVLQPGDTLLIRAGRYAEALLDNLPSGTSWNAPVTIAAYPGETVTMRPGSGFYIVEEYGITASYVIFSGIIFDGTGISSDDFYLSGTSSGNPNHIGVINCEVKNAGNEGIELENAGAGPNYCEFINDQVHNNGTTSFQHGFYIQSNNNLIDGCQIYANAGLGGQIFKQNGVGSAYCSYNIVRNCRIYGNDTAGGGRAAFVLDVGTGNEFYNNVVYDNPNEGLKVEYGATNTLVYNNTFYNNGSYGISVGYNLAFGGGGPGSGAQNTQIFNNISYGNGNTSIMNYGQSTTVEYNPTDSVPVMNGTHAGGGTGNGTSSNNITNSNPLFVNAAGGDFHLQSSSPAINAGLIEAIVATDCEGTTRPQGGGYDIGAYEY